MKNIVVRILGLALSIVFLLTTFSSHAQSDVWKIGQYINIEPKGLDVTFQLIEEFDKTQKVVMGWDGEEQLYALAIDEQPGGGKEENYWQGLVTELKKGSPIDIAYEGRFKSVSGLNITFKIFTYRIEAEPAVQIFYLIKNENIAYWAIAHVLNVDRTNDVYQQSAKLLKSVRLTK